MRVMEVHFSLYYHDQARARKNVLWILYDLLILIYFVISLCKIVNVFVAGFFSIFCFSFIELKFTQRGLICAVDYALNAQNLFILIFTAICYFSNIYLFWVCNKTWWLVILLRQTYNQIFNRDVDCPGSFWYQTTVRARKG